MGMYLEDIVMASGFTFNYLNSRKGVYAITADGSTWSNHNLSIEEKKVKIFVFRYSHFPKEMLWL